MNVSIVVLCVLSIIFVIVNGRYYRNFERLPGKVPFYHKGYGSYEQPPRHYSTNDDQDTQTESDNQGSQDEYNESVGPVHTFVKTDEHAHFKWGVRHYMG